jgi:hypothetical protein
MKIAGYVRPNSSKTNERVRHFCDALGADIISTRDEPVECDLAIQAGFQITPAMADAMDREIPFIILENPVWGKENGVYTWAYNGLNGGGWVPSAPAEVRSSPELLPWRDWQDGETTIFGQVEHDKALRGENIREWAKSVQAVLPRAQFREHPVMLDQRESIQPFRECLAGTSLAITFTSTVGAQTVIAGIPTVATNAGSLAWPVSSHTLEETPITPDRWEWLHGLSYRHIDQHVPIEYILQGYDEARHRAEEGLYDNMSNGRPQ